MRFLLIPLLTLAANGADYQLKATPGTVVWGYYWSAAKPVLRIKSGDRAEWRNPGTTRFLKGCLPRPSR
jgi:hypothetical protein